MEQNSLLTSTDTSSGASSVTTSPRIVTTPFAKLHNRGSSNEAGGEVEASIDINLEPSTGLLHHYVIGPIKKVMSQGLSPDALALSLACGITGGLWPIPGTTSVICWLFIYLFSLNVAVCHLANFLITPVDVFMVIPFIRAGELLFFTENPLPLSPQQLIDLFKENGVIAALEVLGFSIVRAIIAWVLFAIVATPIIYWMLYPIILRFTRRTTPPI